SNAVLLIKSQLLEVRNHANTRQAKAPFDQFYAGLQNTSIAAKFIDHESFEQCPLIRFQKLQRSQQGGEHSTAVDVADQQAGGICGFCHPQIDDVMISQIDFSRRTRAFEQYNLMVRCKLLIAFKNNREHLVYPFRVVIGCRYLSQDFPEQYDLRTGIGTRFDEYGIHFDHRWHSARLRLKRLRASNLPSVGGGSGVERHVLRFEGS